VPGQLRRHQLALSRTPGERAAWTRQRALDPPLSLGTPSFLLRTLLPRPRPLAGRPQQRSAGALRGVPASPGRASGPVRVLRDPTETRRVAPGDALVVTAAVPALAALFGRIAGLCVDGGSVAAHASLLAREYGIPTVVGLGEATARLRDGQVVTVDGSAGLVHLVGRPTTAPPNTADLRQLPGRLTAPGRARLANV
jgi:pyruvate,water dikinase